MVRILHVTECYAGGVRRAIRNIVENVPQYEHHLLWDGFDTPLSDSGYASTTHFRRSFIGRVLHVRALIASLKPDVIHLHSSWAGAYGRILPQRVPVIYQPHAYILSHPNLPPLKRFIYTSAERYFSRNTELVIALSGDEVRTANDLCESMNVAQLTNVASVRPEQPLRRDFPDPDAVANVVMVGRTLPQKDPRFFIQTARAIKRLRPNTAFTWIGDGDRLARKELAEAGVRVTGWLSPDGMADELSAATIYFHSASYEGFPLSVLDAAAFYLPIVVRRIPAFDGMDISAGDNEIACAQEVTSILNSADAWCTAIERSRLLDAQMSSARHAADLDAIYSGFAHVG